MSHVKNIAILGASGTLGSHIVASLLSTNKFTITAISRADSIATFPANVKVARGDLSSASFLKSALQNQDVLISVPSFAAGQDLQPLLFDAAAAVGVPWILPNEFGSDTDSPELAGNPIMAYKKSARAYIEKLGVSRWVGISTNPWWDWVHALPYFGIDVEARKARIFDDGNTRAYLTTLQQVGRAVAALLSLPVAEGLEHYANKMVFIRSFAVTQMEMLAAVQHATGTTKDDWTVESKPVTEEVQEGRDMLAKGDFGGVLKLVYGQTFHEGAGNVNEPLANASLGLVDEDLEEVTKRMFA